jgi:PAS domain-containing protein
MRNHPPVPGARAGQPPPSADGEAKWRAMLEAAPDAIVAVDGSGRITVVNAQTERLFGYGTRSSPA